MHHHYCKVQYMIKINHIDRKELLSICFMCDSLIKINSMFVFILHLYWSIKQIVNTPNSCHWLIQYYIYMSFMNEKNITCQCKYVTIENNGVVWKESNKRAMVYLHFCGTYVTESEFYELSCSELSQIIRFSWPNYGVFLRRLND